MALSSSDIAAIRAAEAALAQAFEAPDPTGWVDFYTPTGAGASRALLNDDV